MPSVFEDETETETAGAKSPARNAIGSFLGVRDSQRRHERKEGGMNVIEKILLWIGVVGAVCFFFACEIRYRRRAERLKNRLVYYAADYGYLSADIGMTRSEMRKDLEPIFGKDPR